MIYNMWMGDKNKQLLKCFPQNIRIDLNSQLTFAEVSKSLTDGSCIVFPTAFLVTLMRSATELATSRMVVSNITCVSGFSAPNAQAPFLTASHI